MANQFVYSSSPHNLDGNSGWGVLTKTSDLQLDGDQLQQMQGFIVEPYSGNDAEDVSRKRQSFSFFKLNGCWLLECSTATGKRWYLGDNRGGEYVAHIYVFDVLPDGFTPFSYLDSDCFWKEIPREWKMKAGEISMMDSSSTEKRYPPVPPLPKCLEPNFHYKFDSILVRVHDVAVPEIGKILETVATRLNNQNDVPCPIFDANSPTSIDTMALVSQLFPWGDRTRLQFSTFLNKDYADRIPTFNELAFYGTVKDENSDSNTGVFDSTTFVSYSYPLGFKSKEDIKAFKEVVDELGGEGSFEDAARRFVVKRAEAEDLPNLLKCHLHDAERLVAEIDAHFPDKNALYDVFKDVKVLPARKENDPEWLKAVRALSDVRMLAIDHVRSDIGKQADYQEAYDTLAQFDKTSAEPVGVWLSIAVLLQEPSEMENVVEKLRNRKDYDSAIKSAILGVMQDATADMPLEEFVELNTQPGIQREVLLQGLSERKSKVDEELTCLQTEADNVRLKLRFAKLGLFLLIFVLLAVLAGGLWIML